MHPMLFGLHYVYEHGIMFLQPIKVARIHPWAFTFGNALEGVHHGEHGHLYSAITSCITKAYKLEGKEAT